MFVIHKAIGVILLVSATCIAKEDFLSKLERRIESHPSTSASASAPSGRSPEVTFKGPSILDAPIASNLAKLISNALKTQTTSDVDITDVINSSLEEVKLTLDGAERNQASLEQAQSSLDQVKSTRDEIADRNDIINNDQASEEDIDELINIKNEISDTDDNEDDIEKDDENVSFAPASAEQFGDLGSGSKLMEYLPDFSSMSIETSDVAGVAGAGAVALMALGAIFAVPVAPVILRRTGTNGWGGLPSWTDLFSWWSSPDPVAETWADKKQHQGYEYNYDTGYYYDNDGHYYAYDTTGSGSDQSNYYADNNANNLQYASATQEAEYPAHDAYDPTASHQFQPSPHDYQIYNGNQRRTRRPTETIDGHEYITLEQLNRIGEESVKFLAEMAKDSRTEELYAYRDGTNDLKRRRLQTQSPSNNIQGRHPQRTPQYQPQPSYVQSQLHFTKSYLDEAMEEETSTKNHQGPEGFPQKDTFSITQLDSEEDTEFKAKSPYRHTYNLPEIGTAISSSASSPSAASSTYYRKRNQQPISDQPKLKVSEFPYEFHNK